MAQEMKVKIMSVNLALKRELAYREKLARLYPNDDSIKHFSPLQGFELARGPPHHAPLLNSKVAPTYSTTKEILTVSASNNTNLFCKVCKVSCSGSFNYEQHVRGQKHKIKLKMQLSGGGNSSGTSQQPRCNLCQIWCTDENNLKLHFDGQKHKAKLKETELHQKGIVLHRQLWCELCQVPCPNEDSFRKHLRGKNHVARLYNTRSENHSAITS